MKYEEYTLEEIEGLAKECERLAEENARLWDVTAELVKALDAARVSDTEVLGILKILTQGKQ
jgi:hypothetical protein